LYSIHIDLFNEDAEFIKLDSSDIILSLSVSFAHLAALTSFAKAAFARESQPDCMAWPALGRLQGFSDIS